MADGGTWYAYECDEPTCTSRKLTGCVIDVRLPTGLLKKAPTVRCPLCGTPMTFRSQWPATHAGYGSRASAKEDMIFQAAREACSMLELALDACKGHDDLAEDEPRRKG